MENFRLPQAVSQTDEEILNVKQNELLDDVIAELGLKNDAALCRAMEQPAPVVSKIRHNKLTIGDTIIVIIHELTGWPVRAIKDRLGKRSIPRYSKT